MIMTNGFSRCLKYHVLTGVLVILAAATATATDNFRQSSLMTVETIGTGQVDPRDPAAAQSAAIRNALDLALDEAIRRLVPSVVLSSNFETIDPLFYGTARNYILNYTVLAVSRGDSHHRVLVRATFADDAMENRIVSAGILLDREITPRVLMLISEKHPDQPPVYWWRHGAGRKALAAVSEAEKAMAAVFGIRGLTPLAPAEAIEMVIDSSPGPDIGRDEAIDLARRAGADFVITGQVEVGRGDSKTSNNQQKWATRAAVRAFDVKTGRLLNDITAEYPSSLSPKDTAGVNDPLTRTGENVAAKLSPSLVTAFQELINQTRSIDILVRGENYLSGLSSFQNRLKSLEAVTRFQLSEMKSSQAVFNVTYAGNAGKLAAALSAASYEKIRITIEDVSENQIIIDINTNDYF